MKNLTLSKLLGCALLFSLQPARAETPERPNIVVVVSDDLGWAYPGFNGGLVEMPHLDRVAARSLNCTRLYVQPVCTPTRAALLTGRYPMHTGTEGRFEGGDTHGMLKDERTLAQALQQAGYFTAMFGKWHLGGWQAAHLPMARGFDHQYGFYGAMIDYYRKMRLKARPRPELNYGMPAVEGTYTYDWHRNQQPLVESGYSTYLIADEVEAVLNKREPGRPFFFYVAFNAAHSPHTPNQVPPEYRTKYAQNRHTQAFCMDQALGRIEESLSRRGLLENTILIFVNDNGGVNQEGENGPWRGGKGTYYEGGVRVPCLVSWPARITQPRRVDALLHVVDFYPTLLRVAGAKLDQPLPVDGRDMSPLWNGGTDPVREEVFLSRHVVVAGRWKFIAKEQGYQYANEDPGEGNRPADELFDLELDPHETTNVAATNPAVVADLRARLRAIAKTYREPEKPGRVGGFESVTIMGEDEARTFRGVEYRTDKDGVSVVLPRP